MKLLENKTVVITGATRGIGLAIAQHFSKHGARLAICGTNAERGAQVAQSLSQEGGDVKFYQVDLSDSQQVANFAEQLQKDFSQIDVLINNAGVTKDQLLMKMKDEDWSKVLDVNLTSIFYLCRALIRPMLKARQGKIINITSVVGLIGNAGQTNYAASKAGLIGFSKSLAKEAGGRGITVNCIAPGFIKTDMTDVLNETQKAALLQHIPLARLGEPSEIAEAALFLSTANYITGQVLTVDGGMVMS